MANAAPLDDSKTWIFSPAVIGTSQQISSVVSVKRSVTKLSDILIVTSCGCVKANIKLVPHNPYMVMIDFVYRPHPPEGDARETIEVVNKHNSAEVLGQLHIEAKVRYPLSVVPKVIDLGHVLAGQTTSSTLVTVQSYSGSQAPKRVSTSPSWLIVTKQQWTPLISKFKISLSRHVAPGPIAGTVVFQSNVPKNQPSLDVVGYVEGDIVATPSEIQFPTEASAQVLRVKLSPHARTRIFPKLQAHSDSALVKVQTQKWSKNSGVIEFGIRKKFARSGINTGQVTLTSSNGKIALTIPYRFIWLH